MAKAYLQSAKNPALKFEILGFDDATKSAKIKGEHGVFVISPFTKEKITKDGYTLVVEKPTLGDPEAD